MAKPKNKTYVAFLRGINIGGNNLIKMDVLRKGLESSGFENVKTVLASGNVIFDAPMTGADKLAGKIAACLRDILHKEIGVAVLRSMDDIRKLTDADPFKGIVPSTHSRFYVTFLSKKPKRKPAKSGNTAGDGFEIVHATSAEICIHLDLSAGRQSTDLMKYLDREFGRDVTTRNWNTIAKILKACG